MIKFIKNLFSSETEQGDWEPFFQAIQKPKYKPRLQKIYGKWYVVNMQDGCYTKPNSRDRDNFWLAYDWTKEQNRT